MRLFILFALFIISGSGVAQTGNANEDYETASTYYEQGDYKNAFRYYMSAAKAGDASAQDAIGDMYNNGDGVAKNYAKAYEWYMKAANQGHYYAQHSLGVLYYYGNGVKQDYMKAFEWYSKAAEQGYDVAQHNLATLYYYGQGVKKDYLKAFEWFSKAANQGDSEAMNALGDMYRNGYGINVNYTKAFELYQESANQNNEGAYGRLGLMYLYGLGVNQNYTMAEKNLLRSIEINSKVFSPYYYLSQIYAKRDKDCTKALQYSDIALSKAESQEEFLKIYQIRGELYLMQNDIENANNMLNKCVEINPNFLSEDSDFLKKMKDSRYKVLDDIDTKIVVNPTSNMNTFAIIIGNEIYKNEADVPYANNDSKIINQYVEKTLGVPHEQIRLIENAGYNDIRIAVNWLVQAMQVCRGKGKAIVYYAGHGIPNESDMSSYLLPVDGIGNDPSSAYSLKELYDKLGSVEAQSVTIFLDACFSGSKREDGMLASARGVALRAKQSTPKGNMIVFTAAQGDETAYPYKDKQHGMFTYFLLKKLQETKGDVTLGELSEYLTDEVGRQSFIKNNKIQTPSVNVSTPLKDSWRKMTLK